MSDSWKEVKVKMWARIKELEKAIPAYEYSEAHNVNATDEKVKEIFLKELRESKKSLFYMLESAYEQQKEGMTRDVLKLRDDIDIFLDEVKIKHTIKWPEDIPLEFLEKIVIHDSDIIKELPKLNQKLEEAGKILMDLEKERPGAVPFDREQEDKLHSRLSEAKRLADELVKLFKEREMLLNLRHIRREREYDDMRREMETKV